MANILTIITTILSVLGVKIPNCLGTNDPTALQRYANRMYNDRRNEYRPVAIRRVTNEAETAAAQQGKTLSYEDAEQIAHCTLDALRKAKTEQVQGVMTASAGGGVDATDPVALMAARAAADYGVTVE